VIEYPHDDDYDNDNDNDNDNGDDDDEQGARPFRARLRSCGSLPCPIAWLSFHAPTELPDRDGGRRRRRLRAAP